MTLSIIVPVFNEEKTVFQVLEAINRLKFPNGIKTEVVMVDDGSTDNTYRELDKAKKLLRNHKYCFVKHNINLGKGSAVISGINKSKGEILTIQDADLEYDPDDLLRLIQPILNKKSEVVFGTRLKQYPLKIVGQKKTPLITHYIGNRILSMVTNTLYGSNLTDMETCHKMFKREVLNGVKLNSKRFELEPEITAKILKKGYKIFEVPIKVNPRGYDEGKKITWRDGFLALWTLLRYRFSD